MNARVSPQFQTAVICSLFLGFLAIDRFIIGRPGLAVAKIFGNIATFGVWMLVDMILICTGKALDGNGRPLIELEQISSSSNYSTRGARPSRPYPGDTVSVPTVWEDNTDNEIDEH